jgi:hypothetical protein
MTFKRFAKGQRPYKRVKGKMTKLERDYAALLELRVRAGEIEWYVFESVTLKLAPDTRYTPDFVVMTADGSLEVHEVKGFMEEAAFVRVKLAASLYPFRFWVVKRPKAGASFQIEAVGEQTGAPA